MACIAYREHMSETCDIDRPWYEWKGQWALPPLPSNEESNSLPECKLSPQTIDFFQICPCSQNMTILLVSQNAKARIILRWLADSTHRFIDLIDVNFDRHL